MKSLTQTLTGERATMNAISKQDFSKVVHAEGTSNSLIADFMQAAGGPSMQMGKSRGLSASLGL